MVAAHEVHKHASDQATMSDAAQIMNVIDASALLNPRDIPESKLPWTIEEMEIFAAGCGAKGSFAVWMPETFETDAYSRIRKYKPLSIYNLADSLRFREKFGWNSILEKNPVGKDTLLSGWRMLCVQNTQTPQHKNGFPYRDSYDGIDHERRANLLRMKLAHPLETIILLFHFPDWQRSFAFASSNDIVVIRTDTGHIILQKPFPREEIPFGIYSPK